MNSFLYTAVVCMSHKPQPTAGAAMLQTRSNSYKRSLAQITSKKNKQVRYTRTTEFCQSYYLSDEEKKQVETTLMNLVECFYSDIVNLVCDYLKPQLLVPLSLDVCDERGVWMQATIVSKMNNYVGVHYNGCSCEYDDWINVGSLRLAPLCTYTHADFILGNNGLFQEQHATHKQQAQTEEVVKQLLDRASICHWSIRYCIQQSLELIRRDENNNMDTNKLVSELEQIHANSFSSVRDHIRLFKYATHPHLFRLQVYNESYTKSVLERKAEHKIAQTKTNG